VIAMTDRVWLHNPETGGTFECPADAAEAWQARGWEPCDPPAEPNPALAEWAPHPESRTATETADAADVGTSPPLAEADSKPTTPRGESASASTEGVNDVG
jgi:hypothetical protein